MKMKRGNKEKLENTVFLSLSPPPVDLKFMKRLRSRGLSL